jgi:hypothetical protein
VLHHEWQWECG